MKILRYQVSKTRTIQLGLLQPGGVLPFASFMESPPDNMTELFKSEPWQQLQTLPIPDDLPLIPLEEVTFLPPIARPGKILCVGLNYRDHVLEGGRDIPEYPTIFLKASSAVIGHQQSILIPKVSQMIDFEAELAVVIGKQIYRCPSDTAFEAVAGYTILNDVSARDYQNRTSQWTMGKSCDTFAPMGPVLVTKDEIPDPHTLTITSSLNGQEMQRSNTKQLIFSIPTLIETISSVMTLEPDDIISTGTPGGVGVFREPPVFMKPGDVIEVTVEKIGTLKNSVQEGVV